MPTVPASAAAARPPGVDPGAMLWEETIAPGGYAAQGTATAARACA